MTRVSPFARVAHPAWMLVLQTAPAALYLWLVYQDYGALRMLMDDETRAVWALYYGWYAAHCLVCAAVALVYLRVRRPLPALPVALTFLGATLVWTWMYVSNLDRFVPDDAPRWMWNENHVFSFPATFVTPGLLYALLLLVERFTPDPVTARRAALSFLGLCLLPALIALMFQLDALQGLLNAAPEFLRPALFIALSLGFVFFLMQCLWMLARGRVGRFLALSPWRYPIYGLFTVAFPLLGLALNNHGEWIRVGESSLADMTYFFGDYSHPVWYVLAAATGALVLLPTAAVSRSARLGLAVWTARFAAAPFTLFFALVFLPYLPLALLAIALLGLGFLMFAPFALLFLHIHALRESYAALASIASRRALWLFAAAGLAVLPTLVSLSYLRDRATLHAALDYVYTPDFRATESGVSADVLGETLLRIRELKAGVETPYLDAYYRAIVLDQLTLPDAKIAALERLFLGAERAPIETRSRGWFGADRQAEFAPLGLERPQGAALVATRTTTRPEPRAGFTATEIELTLEGRLQGDAGQYVTRFTLPPDAVVSDYYLVINGRREPGILAERRAATWIYAQIVSERADPGLLRFVGPRELELRVFPIAKGERRFSGFTLLHDRPLSLTIDGRTLALPAPASRSVEQMRSLEAALRPLGLERAFADEAARRRPQLEFALDCSRAGLSALQPNAAARYADTIVRFLQQYPEAANSDALQLACVDREARWTTVPRPLNAARLAAALDGLLGEAGVGSFFAERAIQQSLFRHWQSADATRAFPIYVLVSPATANVFASGEMPALAWLAPETADVFWLSLDGRLSRQAAFGARSTFADAAAGVGLAPGEERLRAWMNGEGADLSRSAAASAWRPADVTLEWQEAALANLDAHARGLALAGLERRLALFPAESDLRWFLLRESFRHRILSQATAFLALENEAQKEALRRKQKETLDAHVGLDTLEKDLEAVQRMDEPPLVWLALAMLAATALLVWRRHGATLRRAFRTFRTPTGD